jgi:adenylate cyclase
MAEIRISPGVQLAWQIAGDFALEIGANEIHPSHLLFGICSLKQQFEAPSDESRSPDITGQGELRNEVAKLQELFQNAGIETSDVRRRLRTLASRSTASKESSAPSTRKISRSSASRSMFERANEQAKNGIVDLLGLTAAIGSSEDVELNNCWGPPETTTTFFSRCREMMGIKERSRPMQDIESLDPTYGPAGGSSDVLVLETIDAGKRLEAEGNDGVRERFTVLCDLAWESGTDGSVDAMMQRVLNELLRLVPAAERGVILVHDRTSGAWILKAHSSTGTPRISMTSVRQAVEQKKGFHWRKGEDTSRSQKEENLEAGIYAPMLANNEVFGAVCLDSSRAAPVFGRNDLQLVIAIAHQLGLAIANRELRRELTLNARLMERLMTNFSPKVQTRLLQRARQGRLQLGGERATVTILCSDIRGFTRLAAKMEAEDVVSMLNDYFSALMHPIFQNDGTIDKFIGDSILAVFGSPEADPDHCRKAVSAAIQMQKAAHEVSNKRSARGQTCCEIGIGVHCGEVLHGFIGSNERMEYTVIGDAVNLAARYCDAAAGGEVLVSPDVHARVWEAAEAVKTSIPTKHEGTLPAYRIQRMREG